MAAVRGKHLEADQLEMQAGEAIADGAHVQDERFAAAHRALHQAAVEREPPGAEELCETAPGNIAAEPAQKQRPRETRVEVAAAVDRLVQRKRRQQLRKPARWDVDSDDEASARMFFVPVAEQRACLLVARRGQRGAVLFDVRIGRRVVIDRQTQGQLERLARFTASRARM